MGKQTIILLCRNIYLLHINIVPYLVCLEIEWGTVNNLTDYGESILRYSSFQFSYSQIIVYSILLNIAGTFLLLFIFAF